MEKESFIKQAKEFEKSIRMARSSINKEWKTAMKGQKGLILRLKNEAKRAVCKHCEAKLGTYPRPMEERNLAIQYLKKSGWTNREISNKFSISHGRVGQILDNFEFRERWHMGRFAKKYFKNENWYVKPE